jgi:hypothetical protein
MQFAVTFTANGCVVNIPEKQVGTAKVKELKKDCPGIKLCNIAGVIPEYQLKQVTFTVSEDFAFAHAAFKDRNHVKVQVWAGSLNRYVRTKRVWSGRMLSWERVLDKERILKDWVRAGCKNFFPSHLGEEGRDV